MYINYLGFYLIEYKLNVFNLKYLIFLKFKEYELKNLNLNDDGVM